MHSEVTGRKELQPRLYPLSPPYNIFLLLCDCNAVVRQPVFHALLSLILTFFRRDEKPHAPSGESQRPSPRTQLRVIQQSNSSIFIAGWVFRAAVYLLMRYKGDVCSGGPCDQRTLHLKCGRKRQPALLPSMLPMELRMYAIIPNATQEAIWAAAR